MVAYIYYRQLDFKTAVLALFPVSTASSILVCWKVSSTLYENKGSGAWAGSACTLIWTHVGLVFAEPHSGNAQPRSQAQAIFG